MRDHLFDRERKRMENGHFLQGVKEKYASSAEYETRCP